MKAARQPDAPAAEFLEDPEPYRSVEESEVLEKLGVQPHMSAAVVRGGVGEGSPGRLEKHCCDRVVFDHVWSTLPDRAAALDAARMALREHGRLIVFDQHDEAAFAETIQFLERKGWDVHRHGAVGLSGYFVEASVSDESVQS